MSEFKLHARLDADTIFIDDLPLSRLLLINDRQYPWVVLVPRRDSITEAHQLNTTDRHQLIHESDTVCLAMEQLFQPHKLNVASIGNRVPQLHVHHVARFHDDISWPAPVWGAHPAVPYKPQECTQMIDRLSIIPAMVCHDGHAVTDKHPEQ
jgi:diadenosine tetraphosphate (Ap4A) HIT family hydrolase